MRQERWTLHKLPDVDRFVEGLSEVPREAVKLAMERLEIYGDQATEPLVKHWKGSVWELRVKVAKYGLYRIFYFRDGERSFRAFHAVHKKSRVLPQHIRATVARLYKQLTGKKL